MQPTDLVVCDAPDEDVVILPVAIHALHHAVKLTVVGKDPVLVGNVNNNYLFVAWGTIMSPCKRTLV